MQMVILCGGSGTRIKDLIGETPKIMARINNNIFIDYLIEYFLKNKIIHKVTFLTGVGSEEIETYLKTKYSALNDFFEVQKDKNLEQGTSQALFQAYKNNILDKEFFLAYGDSLPDLNLETFSLNCQLNNLGITFTYIDPKYVNEISRIQLVGNNIKYIANLEKHIKNNQSKLYVDYGVYFIRLNEKLINILLKETDLKQVLDFYSSSYSCLGYEVVNPFIEIGNTYSFTSAKYKLKELNLK